MNTLYLVERVMTDIVNEVDNEGKNITDEREAAILGKIKRKFKFNTQLGFFVGRECLILDVYRKSMIFC